jgi:hypothetical protein
MQPEIFVLLSKIGKEEGEMHPRGPSVGEIDESTTAMLLRQRNVFVGCHNPRLIGLADGSIEALLVELGKIYSRCVDLFRRL